MKTGIQGKEKWRIFKKTQLELLEIKYIYNIWSENFTGWDKHCRKKEISELEDTAIKSSQNEVQREKDDCETKEEYCYKCTTLYEMV